MISLYKRIIQLKKSTHTQNQEEKLQGYANLKRHQRKKIKANTKNYFTIKKIK